MPSAVSKILRACRGASLAARSAASTARRCAAAVARSGSGGAAASDPFLRSPSQSRLFFGSGRLPIAEPPPRSRGSGSTIAAPSHRSRGSGSTIAAPPTNIDVPAPGEFVVEDKDLESDEALWALYERWCKAFNQEREYDEMARRFNFFKENVLMVDEANKADLPYKLGINIFTDGKQAEMRSLKLPLIPLREFYDSMPYSDSVIFDRSGDNAFKKGLESHQMKDPNQSV